MLILLAGLACAGPRLDGGLSLNAARTGVGTDAFGYLNAIGSTNRVLPGINLSFSMESPRSGAGLEAVLGVLGPPPSQLVVNNTMPFATRAMLTVGPRFRMEAGGDGRGAVDFIAALGFTAGLGVQTGGRWARETPPAVRAGATLMGGLEVGVSQRTAAQLAWRSTLIQDVSSPYERFTAWHIGTLSLGMTVRLSRPDGTEP